MSTSVVSMITACRRHLTSAGILLGLSTMPMLASCADTDASDAALVGGDEVSDDNPPAGPDTTGDTPGTTDGADGADADAGQPASDPPRGELLKNGDFSAGLEGWATWTFEEGGKTADFNVVEEEMVVDKIVGGGVSDHITMVATSLNLVQGTAYTIAFDARSASPRSISVGPRRSVGDYARYAERVSLIDSAMKPYSFTYIHTAESDPDAQLIFMLGANDSALTVDNVSVTVKDKNDGGFGPTLSILPIGDSITQGNAFNAGTYRKPLYYQLTDAGYAIDMVGSHDTLAGFGALDGRREDDDGWDQDHEAYWGYTTQAVEAILTTSIAEYDFDVALIHLGTNDPNPAGIQNLKDIIDLLRGANPHVVIFLAQLIRTNFESPYIASFNGDIPGVVAEKTTDDSPVILVNQYDTLVPGTDDYVDQFHPTPSGAAKMAAQWFEAIDTYYGGPTK